MGRWRWNCTQIWSFNHWWWGVGIPLPLVVLSLAESKASFLSFLVGLLLCVVRYVFDLVSLSERPTKAYIIRWGIGSQEVRCGVCSHHFLFLQGCILVGSSVQSWAISSDTFRSFMPRFRSISKLLSDPKRNTFHVQFFFCLSKRFGCWDDWMRTDIATLHCWTRYWTNFSLRL